MKKVGLFLILFPVFVFFPASSHAQITVGSFTEWRQPNNPTTISATPPPIAINPFDSGGDPNSVTSIVVPHTIAQTGQVLLVGCGRNDYPRKDFVSATYAGVSMVKLNSGYPLTVAPASLLTTSQYGITSVFMLVNPPVGTANVVISTAGPATNGHGPNCGVLDVGGVNQTTPVAFVDGMNAGSGSSSLTYSCTDTTTVGRPSSFHFDLYNRL